MGDHVTVEIRYPSLNNDSEAHEGTALIRHNNNLQVCLCFVFYVLCF